MLDIQRQIDYWLKGAEDDLLTAGILINEKRMLHGLFFCHLVIEKAIKAYYVKTNKKIAPRTHNLIYLSEQTDLAFNEETHIFLGILMKYQLKGRYPDYNPELPDTKSVTTYFNQTKRLLEWIKAKL